MAKAKKPVPAATLAPPLSSLLTLAAQPRRQGRQRGEERGPVSLRLPLFAYIKKDTMYLPYEEHKTNPVISRQSDMYI